MCPWFSPTHKPKQAQTCAIIKPSTVKEGWCVALPCSGIDLSLLRRKEGLSRCEAEVLRWLSVCGQVNTSRDKCVSLQHPHVILDLILTLIL